MTKITKRNNKLPEQKVIIFGNGAVAKILYFYMKDEYEISAFCADKKYISNNEFCNKPVVPFENIEEYYSPDEYSMIVAVGYVQMNELRKQRCIQAQRKGYNLLSYIDKNTNIQDGVTIGKNCIIMSFVSVETDSVIGDGTIIGAGSTISHDSNISPYNWISAKAVLSGYVNIGECCFWGINSCCANNINIAKKTYIGANTLVSKDTEEGDVIFAPEGLKYRLKSTDFLNFVQMHKNKSPKED